MIQFEPSRLLTSDDMGMVSSAVCICTNILQMGLEISHTEEQEGGVPRCETENNFADAEDVEFNGHAARNSTRGSPSSSEEGPTTDDSSGGQNSDGMGSESLA